MIRVILLIVLAGSIMAGISAFHAFQQRSIVEPVTNLRVWNWYRGGGANAGIAPDQGGILCTVLQPIPNDPSCVELFPVTIVLDQSKKYQITFQAKSSVDRNMVLTGELHGAKNVQDIGFNIKVPLTSEWKSYQYEFAPKAVDGQADKFPIFQLGDVMGTVSIKDVVVKIVN